MWKDLLVELLPKLLAGLGSSPQPRPEHTQPAQPSQRSADDMALAQMNQGITTGLARAVTAQETLVRQLETQLGEQREAVTELGQNMVRVRLAVRTLDGRLERMEKKENAMMRLIVALVVLLVLGLAAAAWFLVRSLHR